MKKFSTTQGFTLLEGIIAITVISIGMTGALSLALSNLSSSEGNENRIIAANLAREGIELVRNQRDTNWLKIDLNQSVSWDTLVSSSGQPVGPFFTPIIDPLTMTHSWSKITTSNLSSIGGTCEGQDCITACDVACQVYYDATNRVYGVSDTSNPVNFQRLLTVQDICYDDPGNSESIVGLGDSCVNTKVGMLVTSIVRYDQRHRLDVVVKERLYNWR